MIRINTVFCAALVVVSLLLLNCKSVVAQNFSKVTTSAIPALTNAKTQWVDINNDDVLDLFITGTTGTGTYRTAFFTNNNNNTFNTINLTTQLTDVAFDFADYNKDGYIDIILSGVNSTGSKKTLICRNDTGTGFTEQSFSITPLAKGGVVWEDFDSDADIDILLAGVDDLNQQKILLYEYKDNDYVLKPTSLPTVTNGTLHAFDANNDGKTEVLITGLNSSGNSVSSIYTINPADLTTSLYSDLSGTAFNTVASGDYNSDGFNDLVISGLSPDLSTATTTLLKNNSVNGFVSISAGLQHVSSPSADIADLNNDGLADIILTGIDDASQKYFKHYRNNAGTSFLDISHSLKNIYSGDATLGDYDNDGDLDLFQIGNSDVGFESNLYKSDQSATIMNNAPEIPTNLSSYVVIDSVFLTWNSASDIQTATNSLSYNLYISKNANGTDLFLSPLSTIGNGYKKIPLEGNAGHRTSMSLKNLPEGRYYWSVQTVDNGFKGSAFSPQQEFAICNPISLGPDRTICKDDFLNISMGSGADVVNWYLQSNVVPISNTHSLTHRIIQDETIIVELTRPFNCTVKDTLVIHVSNPPAISLGNNTAICSGNQFSATVTADSVNWRSLTGLLAANLNTYSYRVLQPQTIIAQAFNEYTCVSYDTIFVNVLALPQFTLGIDQSICYGQNVLLQSNNAGSSVDWLSGNQTLATNQPQYTHHVISNKAITAKVTDSNNCINYDTIQVNVLSLPPINLGADTAICYKQNLELELPATTNVINWFTLAHQPLASNINTYSFQVLQATTVVAEITDANNCVNIDSIVVGVISLPQFNIGANTEICYNKNIILQTGAGFSQVNWYSKKSGLSLLQNSWFYNYIVKETDTLIAEVISNAGCVNYDSIRIGMKPLPIFSLGQDKSICDGDSVKLQIPGSWSSVNWHTYNNILLQQNNSAYNFKAEENTVLWAEVTNAQSCVAYDTLAINVLSLPVFSLGSDRTYCYGDSVKFNITTTGTSYAWRDANSTLLASSKDYKFLAQGSKGISLTITNNDQCSYADTLALIVNALPLFTITGPGEICEKDTITLSVNYPAMKSVAWHKNGVSIPGNSAVWKTLISENSEIKSSLTDTNNCVTQKTVLIVANKRPIPDAGKDSLLCFGEKIMIGKEYGASSNVTVQWSPASFLSNSQAGNPIASPESTTTYTVKVTSDKGCSAYDSVYLEVNPKIRIDAGANTAVCIGESITLGGKPTASGSKFGYTYQWMTGETSLKENVSNLVVTPNQTTQYFVLVSSGKCAVEYDSILVTVNPLPQINIIPDQSIGAGGSVELYASGGTVYSWLPAESLDNSHVATPLAVPLKTTTYTVTVTDDNNCTTEAQVNVLVQNRLFIPNLFTPNGDGKNDVFLLYGSGVKAITLSIFDLHGKKMYSTENLEEAFVSGWDGTSNGKILQDDTYIWTIDGEFYNGDRVLLDGKSSGIIKLVK